MMSIMTLVGSMCFAKPVIEQFPTAQLVYEKKEEPEKKFYKPVYIDTSNPTTKSPDTKTSLILVSYPN